MFHYFGAITTTAGDSLPGWYAEAVDNGGTTPIAIFADAAGATPIGDVSGVADRAKTDSYGNFDFYIADGDYSLRFYNSAGVYQRTQSAVAMFGGTSNDIAVAAAATATTQAGIATTAAATATTQAGIATAQAGIATAQAALASGYADAALAVTNYYATIAAGVAATAVGEAFTSAEDGVLSAYAHIAGSPYYELILRFGGADYITVEQFGAVGVPGTNDQPAIQAAIDYAIANSIPEVRLMATHESWQPAFPGGSPLPTRGCHVFITGDVILSGPDGGSVITLKGPAGATRLKTDGTAAWWSGWLFYEGEITRSVLRNITVLGGLSGLNTVTNADQNVYDKGISIFDNLAVGLLTIDHRDISLDGFAGEMWYMGGTFSGAKVYVENLSLSRSAQSLWNPGSLAEVVAVNLRCDSAYQLAETITGKGHTYVGGVFSRPGNGGSSFIGTSGFPGGGYGYNYPYRDPADPPRWCTFIGTRFERSSNYLYLSSWCRGSIVLVDTGFYIGPGAHDIDLDIAHWTDAGTGAANTLAGPATLTTQDPSAPTGIYFPKSRAIQLRIKALRTAYAIDTGYRGSGVSLYGLIDPDSVFIDVTGDVNEVWHPLVGSYPAGSAFPNTTWNTSAGRGGANFFATVGTTATMDIVAPIMNFFPDAVGVATINIGGAYTYAHGQRCILTTQNGDATKQIKLPISGTYHTLSAPRTLYFYGDFLELEYNALLGKWYEVAYGSYLPMRFYGSATYNAPSIAAGASATTTVTATGASMGDYVDRVSLGIDAAGLIVSGYVSAADTVTVTLQNPTGSAVDLASATLSVEVAKKP